MCPREEETEDDCGFCKGKCGPDKVGQACKLNKRNPDMRQASARRRAEPAVEPMQQHLVLASCAGFFVPFSLFLFLICRRAIRGYYITWLPERARGAQASSFPARARAQTRSQVHSPSETYAARRSQVCLLAQRLHSM